MKNETLKISEKLKNLKIQFIQNTKTDCYVRIPKGHFTVGWSQQYSNTLRYSSLFIREFKETYREKDAIETRIHFTIDHLKNPAWIEEKNPERLFSTKELGKRYLDRSLERSFKINDIHPRGW